MKKLHRYFIMTCRSNCKILNHKDIIHSHLKRYSKVSNSTNEIESSQISFKFQKSRGNCYIYKSNWYRCKKACLSRNYILCHHQRLRKYNISDIKYPQNKQYENSKYHNNPINLDLVWKLVMLWIQKQHSKLFLV